MPVRYRTPPLVEAIFEFAPEAGVLSTEDADRILSVFSDYVGERQDIRPMGAQFDVGSHTVTPLAGVPRIRKWNTDRSRLVQFGADLCAFNALPEYTTFEDYVGDMERLVTAYSQGIGSERTSFLGQRYLNKIVVPDEDPARYFNLFPGGERDNRSHRPFSIQLEVDTLPLGGRVLMTLAYQGQIDSGHQYLLDLYARVDSSERQIPYRWNDMIAWQRAAHSVVERAFEEPLTERCRQMLGREET